jgi:hypothetical protein
MKRPLRVSLALTLVCLSLATASMAESIQTPLANLRDGPDKHSRVVTALPRGTQIDVVETQGNYTLVRVKKTGIRGWVYAPAQGWPVQTLPVPAEPPAPALPTPATSSPPRAATSAPVIAEPVAAVSVPAPPARDLAAYKLDQGSPLTAGEIHLAMDPRDAEVLFLKDPFDKSSFPVRIADANGQLAGEIAVKGSFSRRYLKKSLLITLPKGETWQGRRRLALNAMATDPTQSREWLAWDLAQKLGMVMPQVRYQRLFVNGKYLGLYLDIEWMDDSMFGRLGLAGGELYQPNDNSFCGDFAPASLKRLEDCWNKAFPAGGDLARLAALGKDLNDIPAEQFDTWLDAHFDAQSVIDWLLLNTLTQNGDTYNKNYFLHFSPQNGKWRVIPWDYDLSWGRVADNAQPFPQSIHNGHFQYLYPPVIGAENPLKFKTLKNPRLYARFLSRLGEVFTEGTSPASGWFVPARFQRQLADLRALVDPSRLAEAYPAQQQGSPAEHFDALAFFNEWRYHSLKALLLEPSPFDTPRWLPYTSYDPLTPVTPESLRQRRRQALGLVSTRTLARPGEKTAFLDPLLAYPLAMVTLDASAAPAQVSVEVSREQAPDALPPAHKPESCVERAWYVSVRSDLPVNADLQFDYLDESSTRHELGRALKDERRLALWRHDGEGWQKAAARVNAVANFFVAGEQPLKPGRIHRYVACEE